MTKIIGIENTERINAELEQLMEEVKQRTKTTITRVKIPASPLTNNIVDTDEIIVEQQDGTKRFQVGVTRTNTIATTVNWITIAN